VSARPRLGRYRLRKLKRFQPTAHVVRTRVVGGDVDPILLALKRKVLHEDLGRLNEFFSVIDFDPDLGGRDGVSAGVAHGVWNVIERLSTGRVLPVERDLHAAEIDLLTARLLDEGDGHQRADDKETERQSDPLAAAATDAGNARSTVLA
jgi:hypothetical protein